MRLVFIVLLIATLGFTDSSCVEEGVKANEILLAARNQTVTDFEVIAAGKQLCEEQLTLHDGGAIFDAAEEYAHESAIDVSFYEYPWPLNEDATAWDAGPHTVMGTPISEIQDCARKIELRNSCTKVRCEQDPFTGETWTIVTTPNNACHFAMRDEAARQVEGQ